MSNEIVGKVSLRGNSELVFSIGQWRGGYFASVRKFVATNKYEGPTKSGLSLDRRLLAELIVAARKLQSAVPSLEEAEFARISKGMTEYIRITTLPSESEENLPAVDIREFVDSASYKGPTKKGIRFRWDKLAEVVGCLQQLESALVRVVKEAPTLFPLEPTSDVTASGEDPASHERLQIVEILGEPIKIFPADFLDGSPCSDREVNLPMSPLEMSVDNLGSYTVMAEGSIFMSVRNPAEANYLIYAQLQGHRSAKSPKEMIHLFKCVKSYETYVRTIKTKLFARLLKKTSQETLARYETDRLLRGSGLPILND